MEILSFTQSSMSAMWSELESWFGVDLALPQVLLVIAVLLAFSVLFGLFRKATGPLMTALKLLLLIVVVALAIWVFMHT